MMERRVFAVALSCILCLLPLFAAHADTASDLQQQIDQNNQQLDQLNKEIAQYRVQLDATSQKKQTLQNTLSQLDLQRKKVTASVSITKNQIKTTQLQIQQLASGIATKQASIEDDTAGLAESLRRLNERETQPLSIQILSSDNISAAWEDADALATLQDAVQGNIKKLATEKQSLTDTKTAAEQKNAQLLKQQQTLVIQQGSLDATRKAQSDLLAQTKSQESAFQAIIAQKKAQEATFEKTINDLQSKLKAADTSAIPSPSGGILAWPLDNVTPVDCTTLKKIPVGQSCITQYFGDTAFARTAAYKGQGHNGIDLRASIGTPVSAALTGMVEEINLGVAPNCQYGKWVLIKHNNGLTTLYAHLSSIVVSKGQSVSTGQLIAYSGQTGYATGPHLHFTVYASSGVTFTQYKCNSGPTVKIPISPFNGYLNPLNYL